MGKRGAEIPRLTPHRVADGNLSPESRVALKAIDLHTFHDLRRECGSRWMEAGVGANADRR